MFSKQVLDFMLVRFSCNLCVCVCLARVANINCDSELKVFMILLSRSQMVINIYFEFPSETHGNRGFSRKEWGSQDERHVTYRQQVGGPL